MKTLKSSILALALSSVPCSSFSLSPLPGRKPRQGTFVVKKKKKKGRKKRKKEGRKEKKVHGASCLT